MKKGIAVFLISTIALVGCGSVTTNDKPRLEVGSLGWRNYYLKGESIDLRGLVAKYYVSVESNAEVLPATSEMISGFSTESEGTKSLTVSYKGISATVSYKVFDFAADKYAFQNDLIIGTNQIVHYEASSKSIVIGRYASYKEIRDNYGSPSSEKIQGTYTWSVNVDEDPCFRFESESREVEFAVADGYCNVYRYSFSENTRTSASTSRMPVNSSYNKDTVVLPNKNVLYTKNEAVKDDVDKKNKYIAFMVDDSYNMKVYAEEEEITSVSGLTPVVTLTLDKSILTTNNAVAFRDSEFGSVTYRSSGYSVTWNDHLSISGLQATA